MNLLLNSPFTIHHSPLKLSGSKSETNRLLLLQALYPNLVLENTSDSDDSQVMMKALNSQFTISFAQFAFGSGHNSQLINVHHAGTAMRFLTAYFAIQEGKTVVLTGSSRMKERPIKILVDALQQLGADIHYEEKDGFPPLKITGKKLIKNKVSLPANISSQYISALLLIASKLENGLELTLDGEITSLPYIKMTLGILNELGIQTSFQNNIVKVNPQFTIHNSQLASLNSPSARVTIHNSQFTIHNSQFTIESDWSSASYYYSIIALSEMGTQITLSSYKKNSLQGDSILSEIYSAFGVETVFSDNTITLRKTKSLQLTALASLSSAPPRVSLQLNDTPDLAQTIAVTCFGLGIACHLTGLHTLKIKETDRLQALKNELSKLGANVSLTEESISITPSSAINENIRIKTYQDHRMAMAFAPLAVKVPIIIEEAEVVSKSYPAFWEDLKSIGFAMSEV